MATETTIPAYVQAALPHTCPYCAHALDSTTILRLFSSVEEYTRGDTPYYCITAEFQCSCGTAVINRYVDWNRTVYP